MLSRIPAVICHHARFDPRVKVGGVETFARNLSLVFEEVIYSTCERRLTDAVQRGIPIVCDNQTVLDWPREVPLIGFQHGVAAVKVKTTRTWQDLRMAWAQHRAAQRPNMTWVACAPWVANYFDSRYGVHPRVVHYCVDTERFDGQLDNAGSRLVLHDARSEHKGKRLIGILQKELPEWRFEPLGCPPEAVPDRMRKAAAFIHLSRYEGNSVVCNEGMAMNLPCLFTRVGLFQQDAKPDVELIDAADAYGSPQKLVEHTRRFLSSLSERTYAPRPWVLAHATLQHSRDAWAEIVAGHGG